MPTATKTPATRPAASPADKALSPLQTAGVIYGLVGLVALVHVVVQLTGPAVPAIAAVWLKIIYGYWVFTTFTAIQIGAGRAALSLPYFRNLDLRPRWLWDFAAGLFVSYLVLMALAMTQLLDGVGIVVYLAALGALAWVGFRRWRAEQQAPYAAVQPASPEKPDRSSRSKSLDYGRQFGTRRSLWLVGIVLAAIWLLPYFVQTLLPNTDWDTVAAHLPLAERLLEGRIWDVDPIRIEFNVPGAAHLFFALLLGVGAESAVLPLNFSLVLWLLVAVFSLTDTIWGRAAAVWAVLIAAATNLFWEVSFGARIDLFLAFFCLIAVYAFLVWMRDRQNAWLPLVGAMLGLAAGVKYTAAPFILLLGGIGLVFGLVWFWRSPRSFLIGAVLGTVLLLVPSSFWYARNHLLLGNMLYPFGSPRLYENAQGQRVPLEPDLAKVYGQYADTQRIQGKLASVELSDRPTEMLNLWDVYLHPKLYERKEAHFITPVLLLFVLVPLVRRDRYALTLFGVALVAYVMIAYRTYIIRYALHVLPLLAIGAALVIAQLQSRTFLRGRLRPLAFALAAVFVAIDLLAFLAIPLYGSGINLMPLAVRGGFPLINARHEWEKLDRIAPASYLSGQEDPLTWLSGPFTGYNGAPGMPTVIQDVNRAIAAGQIDPTKAMLMVGEGKGWLLDMPFLPDASREGLPWLAELARAEGDLDAVAESLREQRIGYVLLNTAYFEWVMSDVPDYNRRKLATTIASLLEFSKQQARLIYTSPSEGMRIFEVKSEPGPN